MILIPSVGGENEVMIVIILYKKWKAFRAASGYNVHNCACSNPFASRFPSTHMKWRKLGENQQSFDKQDEWERRAKAQQSFVISEGWEKEKKLSLKAITELSQQIVTIKYQPLAINIHFNNSL